MLLLRQRVLAHSLFSSLYPILSYVFLGTYIPRSPTLYSSAAHAPHVQGAVISLSRTLLPPREPVALENRFPPKSVRDKMSVIEADDDA